ncbi:hypothetical protein E8E13_009835 [Curvularia kusanoi]|uniref:Nephrocystin 3-like N-terminal domain-containing protein n=1 Tax=Curvularia kusanoi TaxID=90978 RepID=A0A9P4TEG2_CURKU|nr:hypothetical protein E8E13_009835 [Curvularia kusanoi]
MQSDRERREATYKAKIQEALRDNKLVIIVGAGVTLSATCPSPARVTWQGLILNGLDYLEDEGFVSSDNQDLKFYRSSVQDTRLTQGQLLRACGYLKSELEQHNQYATWLESVFETLHEDVTQPEILETLGSAYRNGAKLLTTNYDELLERFCHLQRVRRSIPDDIRKFERGMLHGVLHLHGSYQDPDDVVLDATDYYKVRISNDVQSLLRTYLAHYTVLFVGCGSGLEDPNFDALLNWAGDRAKNIPNHHYLLAKTGDNLRFDPLVTIRYGNDYSELSSFLMALLDQRGNDTPVNRSSAVERPYDPSSSVDLKGHHTAVSSFNNDDPPAVNVATFFIQRKLDSQPGICPADIYHSLVLQILRWPLVRVEALDLPATALATPPANGGAHDLQLNYRDILYGLLQQPSTDLSVIVIDGVDNCSDPHEISRFLRDVARSSNASVRVCYSCLYPVPTLEARSTCIAVEDHNQQDIRTYVQEHIPIGGIISEHYRDHLLEIINHRSRGNFLWVTLAIDLLQKYIDEGRDVPFLQKAMKGLPKELSALYEDIITRAVRLNSIAETQVMIRTLQWVLFSARSMSAAEWHHVFAFINMPSLRSIKDWKRSKHHTTSDDLLMQRLRIICCGLVEVRERQVPSEYFQIDLEADSLGPCAGSFENQRYVQVAHQSVYDYLVNGNAFQLMDANITNTPGCGHAYILDVCVRYTFLEEMIEAFQPRVSSPTTSNKVDSDSSQSQYLGESASGSPVDSDDEDDVYVPPDLRTEQYLQGKDLTKALQRVAKESSNASSSNSSSYRRDRNHSRYTLSGKAILKYLEDLESPTAELLTPHSSPKVMLPNSLSGIGEISEQAEKAVQSPPELWQYSQNMLVHHAIAVEKAGITPKKTLELLCAQGIIPLARTRRDMRYRASMTYFAARWNLVNWILYLKQHDSYDFIIEGGRWRSPAIVAIKHNNIEAFRAYFSSYKDLLSMRPYVRDAWGRTVVHHAALIPNSPYLSHLAQLVEHAQAQRLRTDVTLWFHMYHGQDKMEWTPLHLAAAHGCINNVKILLKLGPIDWLWGSDNDGNSPLCLAYERQDRDMAMCKTLIEAAELRDGPPECQHDHAKDLQSLRTKLQEEEAKRSLPPDATPDL